VTLTPTMSPGSIGIGIIASSAELCERELIKLASLSSERVSGGWCCACASGSGGTSGPVIAATDFRRPRGTPTTPPMT
jgi:hypothetical protein